MILAAKELQNIPRNTKIKYPPVLDHKYDANILDIEEFIEENYWPDIIKANDEGKKQIVLVLSTNKTAHLFSTTQRIIQHFTSIGYNCNCDQIYDTFFGMGDKNLTIHPLRTNNQDGADYEFVTINLDWFLYTVDGTVGTGSYYGKDTPNITFSNDNKFRITTDSSSKLSFGTSKQLVAPVGSIPTTSTIYR